jgi:hypothetical protein
MIKRLADLNLPDAGEHSRDQLPERTLAKMLVARLNMAHRRRIG